MAITVDELIENRFSDRTWDDKLRIVSDGKPRPPVSLSAITANDDGTTETKYFELELYDKVQWLTGSEKTQSLFCWPCLLFTKAGIWSKTGINDLVHLPEIMSKHEKTSEHVQAMLDLQMFIMENSVIPKSSTIKLDDSQHNEIIQRNRDILKRLIDVVCNAVIKQQTPRKGNNGCNQIKVDDCIKVLQLLRNYDNLYINHIDDAIDLLKIAPNVITDLVDAITAVMKQGIKKETQQSTYVSFIMSEHSDVAGKSQLSMILRYIKDAKAHEKFIGFTNFGASKSADVVFKHIKNVVREFDMQDRWIAHSYDGGTLPGSELPDLLYKLKKVYNRAFFVPYYYHGLDFVLQQSLSRFKECALFFKTLSSMESYFQKNTKRWKAFEEIMYVSIPNLRNSKWFIRSQFIKVVKTYRKFFIIFFESVTKNCKKWDADDITKASGYSQYLQDFQTVFFLELFRKLFDHTAELNSALKTQTPEAVFDNALFNKVKSNLIAERDREFENLWAAVVLETLGLQEPQTKRIKTEIDDPTSHRYSQLYYKIINHIIQDIEIRCEPLNQLEFCKLLNYNKHGQFVLTIDYIKKLMEFQGPYFDEEQVRNEMIVLRTNGTVFSKKSLYELFEFFNDANLKHTFKNLYKLAELILTMPFKPISVDGGSSKMKNVRNWSYIPDNMNVPGDASLLCVEFDFLQELKKGNSFYNDITAKFYELNKTMELMHK